MSAALAVLGCGLLGAAEAAPVRCANEEIVLEAKQPFEMDYLKNNAVLRDVVITQCGMRISAAEARINGGLNFENSQWTISGDVRITADGGSLSSDKAIVAFRNKLISTATITGTPAQFEQQRPDGTVARGHANTIEYQTSGGTVSFTNNAWISYGRSEVTGQQFVWNMRTQSLEGAPKGTAVNGGRVRFVIQPDKQPQTPAPDKEEKEKKP